MWIGLLDLGSASYVLDRILMMLVIVDWMLLMLLVLDGVVIILDRVLTSLDRTLLGLVIVDRMVLVWEFGDVGQDVCDLDDV